MAYSFDHEWHYENQRLQHLERTFDKGTIDYIKKIGLKDTAICLEVGAGSGSIATWLSNHVPAGRVVATDIQTQFIESNRKKNIEIRKHDIVNQELEQNHYDFIHARALLEHLPERKKALNNMISALKPGGCILIESHDMVTSFPISEVGNQEFSEITSIAVRVMELNGFNGHYGRYVGEDLKSNGIENVQIEGRSFMVGKEQPMTMVWTLIIEQLNEKLTKLYSISQEKIKKAVDIMKDPNFIAMSPLFVAAWGTKANTDQSLDVRPLLQRS